MNRTEIAAKAQEIQNEINAISMMSATTTSGQIAMFKQVRRIAQDLAVLIRHLANNEN